MADIFVLVISQCKRSFGYQPYLLHVALVVGFGGFQESLRGLCLISACPQDTQLVLITQATRSASSNRSFHNNEPWLVLQMIANTINIWTLKRMYLNGKGCKLIVHMALQRSLTWHYRL